MSLTRESNDAVRLSSFTSLALKSNRMLCISAKMSKLVGNCDSGRENGDSVDDTLDAPLRWGPGFNSISPDKIRKPDRKATSKNTRSPCGRDEIRRTSILDNK